MARLARGVALLALTLAVAAGPAASSAAAGVIDYGATADCRYTVTRSDNGVWTNALLKKLVVQPPTMPKPDRSQTIGWRLIVERSLDGGNKPWLITYRSPIQRAPKSAYLTPMLVDVAVPPEKQTPNGRDHVYYRVTLKMFWYGADGSLQNKVAHVMTDIQLIVAGEYHLTDSSCPGVALQHI